MAKTTKPTTKIEKTSKAKPKETTRLIDGATNIQGLNYEFDPYLIFDFARRDPIIRAAKNKKALKVMAGGWSIEPTLDEPDAEAQADAFMEFTKTAGGRIPDSGEQINFDGVLFKALLSLIEGDEIYIEVRNTVLGVPGELHVLDWEDMRIKLNDKKTKIESYNQIINDRVVTKFRPEEIIHRNLFAQGTRKYGRSLIESIMHQAAGRMFAVRYANDLFVNQKPKGIWTFNMDDEEFEKAKDLIKEGKRKAWNDFYIQGKEDKITYKNMDIGTEMAYKDFIQDNRVEILIGMGVPPGSVYLSGTARGWESDVELSEFDEEINFIRTFIENIINDMLLPRFGFNAIKFRFNRSNKRDEEREAKIVDILSDILTVNERREMIGKQAIEGGDVIIPKMKGGGMGVGLHPSPGGHSELDQTEMEGVGVGRETYKINTNLKMRNYFRKTGGGGNLLFAKAVARRIPQKQAKKITHKNVQKIEQLEKEYMNELNELLKNYINKIGEVVHTIDERRFLFKRGKINALKKVADPTREIEELEAIRREFIGKSRLLSAHFVTKAWDYGIDSAQIELDMPLNKIAIGAETIDLLKNMNIDIVEGAMSELGQKAKFHIREGILAGESIPDITKRLEKVKGSVELVYKNRMRTIARTEVSRAMNMGSIEAYKNSNVVRKVRVLIGKDPDGTCSAAFGGRPGQLGKEFSLDDPPSLPNHPNCTCVVVPVTEEI